MEAIQHGGKLSSAGRQPLDNLSNSFFLGPLFLFAINHIHASLFGLGGACRHSGTAPEVSRGSRE